MQLHNSPEFREPEAIDFSALDPDRDVFAEDRLVRNIVAGYRQQYPAKPELLLSVAVLPRRSMFAMFAAAAALLIGVRMISRPAPPRPTTVAESIGVPPEFLARVSAIPIEGK